jgi:hypothetical protein
LTVDFGGAVGMGIWQRLGFILEQYSFSVRITISK